MRAHLSGRPARAFTSRLLVLLLLLVAVAPVLPAARAAASEPLGGSSHLDSWVAITGRVDVRPGDVVDGPVVLVNGDVMVAGTVTADVFLVNGSLTVVSGARVDGAVTVLNGSAVLGGSVGGDVTVLNGSATVAGTAAVGGDVRASARPLVATGATVGGAVGRVDPGVVFSAAGFALLGLWWLMVTFSTLLLGLAFVLLLPRAAAAAEATARRQPGRTAGWGAIVAAGVPVAVFLAVSSFVGLPLALAVMASLSLVASLGYVVAALAFGRVMVREGRPVVAFLAGFAVLRVAALVPGLGLVVWALAAAFGVGALAVAGWRAAHRPSTTAIGAPLPPPTVPVA